jgi:hypothetical protein
MATKVPAIGRAKGYRTPIAGIERSSERLLLADSASSNVSNAEPLGREFPTRSSPSRD